MSLKYGKTEIAKMAAALNAGHTTVEGAAQAALLAAEAIFEDRAKFVVVGQLTRTPDGPVKPTDPEAVMVSLGWYSTEGEAKAAATALWTNLATGETFRTVVLPVHHGTPAEFHKLRKQVYEAQRTKAMERKAQEIRDFIAKQQAKNAALAAEGGSQ